MSLCDSALTEDDSEIISLFEAVDEKRLITAVQIPFVLCISLLNVLYDPGWNGDITYVVLMCNHLPHAQVEYFIAPLEFFSGPQKNTAHCLLLCFVGNFTIVVGFYAGAKYELAMIDICKIAAHDNVAWVVNI